MDKLKSMWAWIVGVVGAIVGLLLLRDYFQRDLKAEAKTAETDLKSAVLDEKLKSNADAQAANNNATAGLVDGLNKAKEDAKTATSEQATDFWKKH